MKIQLSAIFFLGFIAGSAFGALKTESVTYFSGADEMVGYVAYDDSIKTPRPGILIVHDWMGLSQFTKDKADQLAKEGYVAFAADVYGKGIRPKNMEEASKLASKYKGDRNLLRAHMNAAFEKLSSMSEANAKKNSSYGILFWWDFRT